MTQPTLDPQAQALLDEAAAAGGPPVSSMSVGEVRQMLRAELISDAPLPEVRHVEQRHLAAPCGGFPVRIYRPSEGTLPLLVFFHGGGWALNDLDTHDRTCRRLALACDAVVVSVGYRRSPEHPYPAAVEDCYLATAWAVAHAAELDVDPRRVGVVGDSSGGANVAAVTLLARDRGFPALQLQVLVYPVTDAPSAASDSYEERGTGYALDTATMYWFWDLYVGSLDHVDLDDPYLCPLRAKDLGELPEAVVVTAEFDPLRDEGRRYAARLRDAGNDVEHHHVADQMHNFLVKTDAIDRADEEVTWLFEQVRSRLERLGTSSSSTPEVPS